MKVEWKFMFRVENPVVGSKTIAYGDPLGLNMSCHDDVYQIAEKLDYQVKVSNKTDGRWYAWVDVSESPDSLRLANLLSILEQRYGFKPWPYAVFDMRQRDKFFGVERKRVFSKKEINSAEYLSFFCSTSVGHAVYRTEEQFTKNSYVVDKVKKPKNPNRLGCLQPFNALALSPQMRNELLSQNLVGLDVDDEVIGSKGNLYKLGSHIILPRTLTRLVNGQGEDVDPDVWKSTTIHGGTEDHLYDDGHRPCILRYRREDFDSIGPFDIAMRYEFIGNHKQGAYRGLVVSQRFRQVLKELKVRGVHYFPIKLE